MVTKKAMIISESQKIISQYGGMKLTVRQIYYRLVAAQLIKNNLYSYQAVGKALGFARLNDIIPFDHIEDRTRKIHQRHTFYDITESTYAARNEATEESPESFLNGYLGTMRDLPEKYTIPRWWNQPNKVMVLVEKQALSALFQAVTDKHAVDLVVCRGYPSLTLLNDIAEELLDPADYTENIELLYFGDFDPSGADIIRNVSERLEDDFGVNFNLEHIAITVAQIKQYNIPPAPAKPSDPRHSEFVEETGLDWQVELDAIEPKLLQGLVDDSIVKHFDETIFKNDRNPELENRRERLREWADECLNEDFEEPEED